MIRVLTLVFFVGCAMMVGRYYGLGSTFQLLAVVTVAIGLTSILSSSRRLH